MLLSTLVSLALTCYILDWDDHRLNDDHERVHVVCAVNAAIGVVLAVLSALYVLHDSSTKKFFLMLCSCLLVGVASAYVLAGSTFVLTQYGHYGSYENVILTGLDSGHDGDHDHGHGHNDGSSDGDGSGSGSGVGSMAFHTGGMVGNMTTLNGTGDWDDGVNGTARVTPFKVAAMAVSWTCEADLSIVLYSWVLNWAVYAAYNACLLLYCCFRVPLLWAQTSTARLLTRCLAGRGMLAVARAVRATVGWVIVAAMSVNVSLTVLSTLALTMVVPLATRDADPTSYCSSIAHHFPLPVAFLPPLVALAFQAYVACRRVAAGWHTGGAVATALATQPLLDDWQLPARAVAAVMAARRRRWRQLRGSPRHGLHCACRSGVGCVVPHSSGGWEGVVSPKSVDAEVA